MNDPIDDAQKHSMTASGAKFHVTVSHKHHSEVVIAMQERDLVGFLPQDKEHLKRSEVSNVLQALKSFTVSIISSNFSRKYA